MRMYLTETQIQSMKGEIATARAEGANPMNPKAAQARKYADKMQEQLKAQSAPELKGEAKDKAVRRERELREKFVPALISNAEMRANPPGAADHLRKVENGKYQQDILEWKNVTRALNPGDDSSDLCNIDRLRPKTPRMNMDNAEIQTRQYSIPSEAFKQNFDGIDWGPLAPLIEQKVNEVIEQRLAEAKKAAEAKPAKAKA